MMPLSWKGLIALPVILVLMLVPASGLPSLAATMVPHATMAPRNPSCNLVLRVRGGATAEDKAALDELDSEEDAGAKREEKTKEEKAAPVKASASAVSSASKAKTEPLSSEALRESAKRRAEQAKSAGKAKGPRGSLSKSIYRMLSTLTNRLGITGSSTRVVMISPTAHSLERVTDWCFDHQEVTPLKTLDKPKPSSGGGRGSFSSLNKRKEMRMADLPPMPGG